MSAEQEEEIRRLRAAIQRLQPDLDDEGLDDENLRTWKEERPSSPFLNVGEGEYGMGTEPTS